MSGRIPPQPPRRYYFVMLDDKYGTRDDCTPARLSVLHAILWLADDQVELVTTIEQVQKRAGVGRNAARDGIAYAVEVGMVREVRDTSHRSGRRLVLTDREQPQEIATHKNSAALQGDGKRAPGGRKARARGTEGARLPDAPIREEEKGEKERENVPSPTPPETRPRAAGHAPRATVRDVLFSASERSVEAARAAEAPPAPAPAPVEGPPPIEASGPEAIAAATVEAEESAARDRGLVAEIRAAFTPAQLEARDNRGKRAELNAALTRLKALEEGDLAKGLATYRAPAAAGRVAPAASVPQASPRDSEVIERAAELAGQVGGPGITPQVLVGRLLEGWHDEGPEGGPNPVSMRVWPRHIRRLRPDQRAELPEWIRDSNRPEIRNPARHFATTLKREAQAAT